MKTAVLAPEGLVQDDCGAALVLVYKPVHRLRTALKALGEIERADRGAWRISDFSKHLPRQAGQSFTGHSAVCRAARDVLEKRLAGDGEFHARGYLT
jgi:hypothetical protein